MFASKSSMGVLSALAVLVTPAFATTVSTSFNTADGFVTSDTNDITLTEDAFEVTFSGGQQQQMFDGPSYTNGPAGYLFINGVFEGATGQTAQGDGVSDDGGFIDFNKGVTDVSFFAANRGFGAGVTVTVLGTDNTTVLATEFVTATSNRIADGAQALVFNSSDLGALIGRIVFDLPGPAANPPYVLAIDEFSASAVPLPGAAVLMLGGLGLVGAARRRARQQSR